MHEVAFNMRFDESHVASRFSNIYHRRCGKIAECKADVPMMKLADYLIFYVSKNNIGTKKLCFQNFMHSFGNRLPYFFLIVLLCFYIVLKYNKHFINVRIHF